MASCRILNQTYLSVSTLKLIGFAILTSVVIISCGTTETTQRDSGEETTADNTTAEETGVSQEFMALLNTNRSKLTDPYSSLNSNIPEVFLQESTTRNIGNPNEGYRIQIVSTRNVAQADSIANDFRFWAEDNFIEYVPKAYVLFRQPYYKVHVGNFQFQDHAMILNQMIKERYPDAWVVHDEVEPNLVPADTSSIRRK